MSHALSVFCKRELYVQDQSMNDKYVRGKGINGMFVNHTHMGGMSM